MKVIRGNEEFNKDVLSRDPNRQYTYSNSLILDINSAASFKKSRRNRDFFVSVEDCILSGWDIKVTEDIDYLNIRMFRHNEIRNCNFEYLHIDSTYLSDDYCIIRNCKIKGFMEAAHVNLNVVNCDIEEVKYSPGTVFKNCSIGEFSWYGHRPQTNKAIKNCKIGTVIVDRGDIDQSSFEDLLELSNAGTKIVLFDSTLRYVSTLCKANLENFYFFNVSMFGEGSISDCDFSKTSHFFDNEDRFDSEYSFSIEFGAGTSAENTNFGSFDVKHNERLATKRLIRTQHP